MQIWFNILDMGFSPALAREVSSSRVNTKYFKNVRQLLRAIELYFSFISIIFISIFFCFSDVIASDWIKAENISEELISYCLGIMVLIIGLRWFSTLYKSGINGMEDQLWLNIAVIGITSLKYFGSTVYIIFISNNIGNFFEFQLFVYLLETFLLMYRFYYHTSMNIYIPSLFQFNFSEIRKIFPFAISIAYSTTIWIIIRQIDKLLLSNILSLREFGYMNLVTLLSSSLVALSTPLFSAITPRIILENSLGNKRKVISMYSDMVEIISWFICSIAAILCLFPEYIIFILTDNMEAAIWCSKVLPWYILGSTFFVIGTCQYYLQNIFGDLKLFATASSIAFLLYVPSSYYLTTAYGPIVAGKFWSIFSLLWLFILTPVVQNKFSPSLNRIWFKNLFAIIFFILIMSLGIFHFVKLDVNQSKILLTFNIFIISIIILFVSSLTIRKVRNAILSAYHFFNKILF